RHEAISQQDSNTLGTGRLEAACAGCSRTVGRARPRRCSLAHLVEHRGSIEQGRCFDTVRPSISRRLSSARPACQRLSHRFVKRPWEVEDDENCPAAKDQPERATRTAEKGGSNQGGSHRNDNRCWFGSNCNPSLPAAPS